MTTYFCWKCKTKDHWANEVCPKDVVASILHAAQRLEKRKSAAQVASEGKVMPCPPELVGPVGRGVGRPKIYPDRKTQMRELMRRRRARSG